MAFFYHFTHLLTASQSLGLGTALHVLCTALVVYHVLSRPRDAHDSILWIFAAFALPALGPIAYLLFGINTVPEKAWKKQSSDRSFRRRQHRTVGDVLPLLPSADGPKAAFAQPAELNRILARLAPTHSLVTGNSIKMYLNAVSALDAMFAAIRSARSTVHLTTYILNNDEIGRRLMDLLAEKAREGVKVRVLYDAFGSFHARIRLFFRRYREVPNLEVVAFSQANLLKQKFQFALRNHRKLLIVDGHVAFTGGVNFHAVYLPKAGKPGFEDCHFRVTGPAVLELQYTFLRDWYYMTDSASDQLLTPEHFPELKVCGDIALRVQNSGPTHEEASLALDSYFAAINSAQRQVLIMTPYFIPPESLMRAMRLAALRGVDVQVLVPAENNNRGVQYASRALYAALLAAGVRIFERRPPFIHAKMAIIDDSCAFIGSANVDRRSLSLNYETNLAVFNDGFAMRLKAFILGQLENADEVLYSEWRKRSMKEQLLENFFNLFHPIA